MTERHILLTGATGFVGGHVVRALRASWLGRMFAWLSVLFGTPVAPRCGSNVAAYVMVRPNAAGVVWTRIYQWADGSTHHVRSTKVVTDDGRLRWTPREKDVGLHLVRLMVEDKDGGVTAQNFLLEVSDDTEPFAPNPAPMSAECFRSLQPTITVGNTNDPDGDALTYFFEVSDDGAFDGTDVVASPPVQGGRDGFTRWMVSRPLDPGGIYYWRAWTTDGVERSGEIRGALCIQPDELPPPAQPPSDDLTAGLEDRPGQHVQYGCSTTGGSPGALAPLVAVLAFIRRRR